MLPYRVRYQTIEFGELDIHLQSLRDKQEFSDEDGVSESLGIYSSNWSLFGVLWGSSFTLAKMMKDYDLKGRRILEIGCGLGLASLVLNHRQADITATDYHPEAERFLDVNATLNEGKKIPFVRADWNDGNIGVGDFDLIIGSDLLYERGHAKTLSSFVDSNAKNQCEVIMVDPGRGRIARFGRFMHELGYEDELLPHTEIVSKEEPSRRQVHRYTR